MTARQWTRADVRAGWLNAARTPGARVFGGWRVGALDYVTGYAARVIVSGVSRGRY